MTNEKANPFFEEICRIQEICRLQYDCAEAYQVVSVLACHAGLIDHPAVLKALDNLSAAANEQARPHDDLLPFLLE